MKFFKLILFILNAKCSSQNFFNNFGADSFSDEDFVGSIISSFISEIREVSSSRLSSRSCISMRIISQSTTTRSLSMPFSRRMSHYATPFHSISTESHLVQNTRREPLSIVEIKEEDVAGNIKQEPASSPIINPPVKSEPGTSKIKQEPVSPATTEHKSEVEDMFVKIKQEPASSPIINPTFESEPGTSKIKQEPASPSTSNSSLKQKRDLPMSFKIKEERDSDEIKHKRIKKEDESF